MKLTLVGGGGFRVPHIASVFQEGSPVRLDELCLYDVDQARLEVMANVLEQLGLSAAMGAVTVTTSLDEAVTGADYVFSAMRVSGACGRVIDEREALSRGLLGQETVGIAGYAFAFRQIPEALRLARAVAELAPDAWVLNFTNPAGIITQAMRTVHPRVVGICDTPIGMVRRAMHVLGIDEGEAEYDYVGLNHLGWLRTMVVGGVDRLPELLADDAMLGRMEETQVIGADWIRALGHMPNEYLYYYYKNREIVARLRQGQTRGEFLVKQQGHFYKSAAAFPEEAGRLWQEADAERNATYMAEARQAGEERPDEGIEGGYQRVALELMNALSNGADSQFQMILGVGNADADDVADNGLLIPELRADAIVEVPCRVDAQGIHPQRPARVSGPELGLMASVKACEELVIDAALAGDREIAWKALASHPLVDSIDLAREVLEAYIKENPDIARVFA
ncbi:6-phospho-beta-glucosidase [Trueperella pecoris]|uniref:6-phospho-beta-glucosidase n=1 Tax=Trueperella pecoris TaxID=2733571 RepID=A0A7M1R0Y6_9ACTO|nr:6-phospho-beta-glucosidase [Trueperella pecoris]QOR47816.1 6-phospho-beta-glucosidase [Trueperella pecoris]